MTSTQEDVQVAFVPKLFEALKVSSFCSRLAAAPGQTETLVEDGGNGVLITRTAFDSLLQKVVTAQLR